MITFRDEIAIRGAPAEVWTIISAPSLMPLWNAKCLKCDGPRDAIRRGSRYKATFRMKGPEQEMWCEVVDCAPTQLLKTRYTGKAFRNGGYVDEVFQLTPSSTGTRLTHGVDFTHSGLPWIVRVLMYIIHTFGYSVGKSSLDGIKKLTEETKANTPSQGMPHPDRQP